MSDEINAGKIKDVYIINSFIHSLHYFNASFIGAFTWLTHSRPYRATTCRKRELTLDLKRIFWPHKDMEGLLGWEISSMPEPPPRQHKHERQYTPGTHLFILIRWIWKDDYDGQMIFGDLVVLKHPGICLTGQENPENPGNFFRPGFETGARCVTDGHAFSCSTAVDKIHRLHNRNREPPKIKSRILDAIWPKKLKLL